MTWAKHARGESRDAVTDAELLVDRMCTILARRAVPGSVITCRFTVRSRRLVLAASTHTDDERPPSTASFERRAVENLADTAARVDADSTDRSGAHVVHVELVKQWPLG
ncbi:hypothetical protein H0B56_20340 [Haloechinothrix sp. YIM 98757]|uniref:Uncharacterized protein n=1 Tax=Haloechinothrix aidingensis TaxID=2752311 RepID=A0A838AF65_9PSEU|nr:hypothetical protein [Haloechinothrix aidingensis]MBA0127902.1 hypothetical protein [Haloechinothrix aidingensis]